MFKPGSINTVVCRSYVRPSCEIAFLKITKKSTKPLADIIRLIEQNLQAADILPVTATVLPIFTLIPIMLKEYGEVSLVHTKL
jgi:hypothetical protein